MTVTTDLLELLPSLETLTAGIEQRIARDYQDWVEASEEDRARGHRRHHCQHGNNEWTDYDNICGPCEDGFDLGDPATRHRTALEAATDKLSAATKALTGYGNLIEVGLAKSMTGSAMQDLVQFVTRQLRDVELVESDVVVAVLRARLAA